MNFARADRRTLRPHSAGGYWKLPACPQRWSVRRVSGRPTARQKETRAPWKSYKADVAALVPMSRRGTGSTLGRCRWLRLRTFVHATLPIPSTSAAGDRVGTEARKQAIALSTFFKTSRLLQTRVSPLTDGGWMQYQTLRSVSDHHVFVVCEDIDLRCQQPNLSS